MCSLSMLSLFLLDYLLYGTFLGSATLLDEIDEYLLLRLLAFLRLSMLLAARLNGAWLRSEACWDTVLMTTLSSTYR